MMVFLYLFVCLVVGFFLLFNDSSMEHKLSRKLSLLVFATLF